jgi:hypothetical protein
VAASSEQLGLYRGDGAVIERAPEADGHSNPQIRAAAAGGRDGPARHSRHDAEAEYTNQFDLTAINAAVQNNPGRASAKLMAAIGASGDLTRSELEGRFLDLIDRHGVEPPQTAVTIDGYELDFLWTRAGLIVELDGLAAHTTRRTFDADRLRDRRLWRRGLRTMRLTSEALLDEAAVLEDLAQAGVIVPSRPRASSKPPRRSRTSPASAT